MFGKTLTATKQMNNSAIKKTMYMGINKKSKNVQESAISA